MTDPSLTSSLTNKLPEKKFFPCLPYFPWIILPCLILQWFTLPSSADYEPLQYNNPGLVVDLHVGLWAWPLPMDWDGDGDLDLVVSCPDVPFNGTYFFENPGGDTAMPTFKPPVRVGDAVKNARISYIDGQPRILTPEYEWTNFLGGTFEKITKIRNGQVKDGATKVRANQWHYADYDGDGATDLIIGIGTWDDYGWDDAHDDEGNWINGPLHGLVFVLRNEGTNEKPQWSNPVKVEAGGAPVDVYGMPSPSFADFDGDGDLDLICGEFMDGFTWFQNTGTRTEPVYATGKRLQHEGKDIAMHLQMITPTAIDWDHDGDPDLIVGDEDGRVAFLENTGSTDADGTPAFLSPAYFQQEAHDLIFGALVTPVGVDWDGDGDEDLVCGNSSGNIGWFENLDGANPPRWGPVVLLQADGETIHLQAGPKGSIQGPCEAKWGYTTLSIADWNHDGLHDLVVNSIWGLVLWYKNIGTATEPKLAAPQPVSVAWEGAPPKPSWNWWTPNPTELSTQWRTTPVAVDWNGDKLTDLVMLDHEGYLAFFERQDDGMLLPGQRIFRGGTFGKDGSQSGNTTDLLRLNDGDAGKSGRRKLSLVDWDGDGDRDLLLNSTNIHLLENTGTENGITTFGKSRQLGQRRLAGHTTSPTTVDWDNDGKPDLVAGAEDGRLYYLKNE